MKKAKICSLVGKFAELAKQSASMVEFVHCGQKYPQLFL